MSSLEQVQYTGIDVLEVMAEAENYNRYLHALIGKHIASGARVLDFGAGIGTFALPLARRGIDIVCVEPDSRLAAQLQLAGIDVAASLAEIAPESIDFIYTLNVLEHIDDDAGAVCALAARLRPGGKLLVYVPAFQVLYSSFDRKIGHLRRYVRRTLAGLAEAAGLQIAEACYADSLGFLAALLYRLIDREDGGIGRGAVRLYDRFVFPLSKVADRLLSAWFGKNLLVVAEKRRRANSDAAKEAR